MRNDLFFFLITFSGLLLLNKEAASCTFSQQNLEYIDLLDSIEQFSNFIRDSYKKEQEKEKNYTRTERQIKEIQLKNCDKMYHNAMLLIKGSISLDRYINELLRARLSYLERRTSCVGAYGLIENANFYPTTDWKLFKEMMKDPALRKDLPQHTRDKERYIIKYQIFNLMIKEAFDKVKDLRQLSTNTIKLLNASHSLHAILKSVKGQEIDLGHPDQAGGYILFKELFTKNLTNNDARKALKVATKFFYDNFFIDPGCTKRTELFFKKHRGVDVLSYWELTKDNRPFPSLAIPCPKAKSHPNLKKNDCLESNSLLPYPLSREFEFYLKNERFAPYKEVINIGPSFFSNPSFQKKTTTEERVYGDYFDNKNKNQQKRSSSQDQVLIPKKDKPLTLAKVSSFYTLKEEPINLNSREVYFTRYGIFHLPRGVHRRQLSRNYAVVDLKKKSQKKVNHFFDKKKQNNMTFHDFSVLFESNKVGGKILNKNNGSRHKNLVGPQGEFLWGIFASSKYHSYGKHYMPYLLLALLYVGLRPS